MKIRVRDRDPIRGPVLAGVLRLGGGHLAGQRLMMSAVVVVLAVLGQQLVDLREGDWLVCVEEALQGLVGAFVLALRGGAAHLPRDSQTAAIGQEPLQRGDNAAPRLVERDTVIGQQFLRHP